jgi:hypothetical protein
VIKNFHLSWAWWHISVILALERLRQENSEFQTRLGYTAKQNKTNEQTKIHVD